MSLGKRCRSSAPVRNTGSTQKVHRFQQSDETPPLQTRDVCRTSLCCAAGIDRLCLAFIFQRDEPARPGFEQRAGVARCHRYDPCDSGWRDRHLSGFAIRSM